MNASDENISSFGRLLLAGVGGGIAVGGISGAVMLYEHGDPNSWWVSGAVVGASIGLMSGLVTQSVTGVSLHLMRRRSASARSLRAVAVCVPVACATLVMALFATRFEVSPGSGILLVVLAATLTAIVATVGAPWALLQRHRLGSGRARDESEGV